jgi:hypothetical protein
MMPARFASKFAAAGLRHSRGPNTAQIPLAKRQKGVYLGQKVGALRHILKPV